MNFNNETYRLQAEAANMKAAMDLSANVLLERVKTGEFKGYDDKTLAEKFDSLTTKLFKLINERQTAILDKVSALARS